MSHGDQKKRDSVAELLTQLKRGNNVTKEEVDEAVTYHTSLVAELQAYGYVADFSHGKPQAVTTVDKDLQREFDNLKGEYRLLGNKLKYYTDRANNVEEINSKDFGNSGQLQKFYEEYENNKSQFEKLTHDITNMQRELSESKSQTEHYRCELDKLNREYKSTVNKFEDYKRVHSNLKDKHEKLYLDHDHVKTELEDTKNECNKLKVELENRVATKEQENQNATEFERNRTSGVGHDGGAKKEDSVTQEKGQSKALEKLKQQNQQLTEDNKRLVDQISELRNRLSVMAGHKLTDGNPQIADLSDAFRPTKIAEQFRQLYDDEWTHAFEELDEEFKREEEIIELLADIIKNIDNFCIRAGSKQLKQLMYHAKRVIREPECELDGKEGKNDKFLKCPDAAPMTEAQEDLADKLLKDFRKSLGIISKTPLLMMFRQVSPCIRDKLGNISSTSKGLKDFLEKAFPLIWVMKLQDPAMEFVWSKSGDKFDKTMFSHYTKRGDTVTQCVWPAVVLHKAGPLMSKGVVQGD